MYVYPSNYTVYSFEIQVISVRYHNIQVYHPKFHTYTKSQSFSGLAQVGAVDEIRTRDIHLGKVALYH